VASEQGLRLASARVGRLELPPALVVVLAGLAGDLVIGDRLGTAAIRSVEALRVSPPEVTVLLAEEGRAQLYDRVRARVRAGSGDGTRVYVQLWWIDRTGREGGLPTSGSVLPYLAHAVRKAAEAAEGAKRAELKGAILALTLYCGDHRVAAAVGATLADHMTGAGNRCAGTTLGGRDDLKRHFMVSAGIHAASTDQAVLGVGELKELLDSNAGGSGFSFDDIAADLAGARFAAAFLEAPPADWEPMLARIRGEADILPDLSGLPTGLSEAEFRARYGDVDSPAYQALLAEIGRRIDALPLYRGLPTD
jgi:uncharacterized protein YfiM (DUF2279 family)